MNEISKSNPMVAFVLSLFLGPIGYAYIGGWFMLSGIIISILFLVVLSIINLPYPDFINYLQLLVYANFGYKLATIKNIFAEEWNLTDEDTKEFKSFGFSFVTMTNLLSSLVQFYSVVVGLYLAFKSFSDGNILIGILILIFGIGIMIWLLNSIFAFVSALLMLLFKLDKKYF